MLKHTEQCLDANVHGGTEEEAPYRKTAPERWEKKRRSALYKEYLIQCIFIQWLSTGTEMGDQFFRCSWGNNIRIKRDW